MKFHVISNFIRFHERAHLCSPPHPVTMSKNRFVDDYLSYLLGRASHAVYKAFDAQVKAAGLSSLEWRVLATLADGDGLTIGDLAQEVLALQPTLTKLIQRMEQDGWVEIGADGTVSLARLTHATLDDPAFQACVASAVRRWRFPAFEGEHDTIFHTFTFRARR